MTIPHPLKIKFALTVALMAAPAVAQAPLSPLPPPTDCVDTALRQTVQSAWDLVATGPGLRQNLQNEAERAAPAYYQVLVQCLVSTGQIPNIAKK
jgi:hypothetical protein